LTLAAAGEPVREQSWHRYAYTLFSTVGRVALGAVTSIVVPRTLGPAAIGTLAFGQIIAQNLRGLSDFNIGQSFFTLSAATPRSGSITRLFLKVVLTQLTLTVIMCLLIGGTSVGQKITQGTPLPVLLALLLLEWALYGVTAANQLGDSKGVSRWPQSAALAVNVVTTATALGLARWGHLTLWSYVVTLLTCTLLNLVVVVIYLGRTRYDLVWARSGTGHLKTAIRTIVKISLPLTIVGYYAMGIEFAERFLIQQQYGPVEQAYYQVASRWASLIILFSTASLQIFWQRLIESISAGDLLSAKSLYLRLDGLLFYFTLCLAMMWSAMGKDVVALLLGKRYEGAGTILTVMAFYPVSQVFGQLGSTIALASGRARAFSVVTMATATAGLMVSYIMLAPPTASVPGLGLGGIGLALKTAVMGLVMVQPLTFLNCRYLSISYWGLMKKKATIFAILTVITAVLYLMATTWLDHVPTLVDSSLRAALFGIAATTLLVKRTQACGIYPDDLRRVVAMFSELTHRLRRPL
jgi:O-antigen/teichoic acid export membrane protein